MLPLDLVPIYLYFGYLPIANDNFPNKVGDMFGVRKPQSVSQGKRETQLVD